MFSKEYEPILKTNINYNTHMHEMPIDISSTQSEI